MDVPVSDIFDGKTEAGERAADHGQAAAKGGEFGVH